MEEYSEFEKGVPLIDKTDWRSKIRDALWNCIKVSGWYPNYIFAVEQLIDTFSAEYPGFNTKEKIDKEVVEVKQKYRSLYDQWYKENSTTRRWTKREMKERYDLQANHEIFEYIKNLYARKRGLLYGVKRAVGGTQLKDPDEE